MLLPYNPREDLTMDLGLKDRVAIVAGASKGLGKAAALGLAAEGTSIVICSRGAETLNLTAEEIRKKTGAPVLAVVGGCDATRRYHPVITGRTGSSDRLPGVRPVQLHHRHDDPGGRRVHQRAVLSYGNRTGRPIY